MMTTCFNKMGLNKMIYNNMPIKDSKVREAGYIELIMCILLN